MGKVFCTGFCKVDPASKTIVFLSLMNHPLFRPKPETNNNVIVSAL